MNKFSFLRLTLLFAVLLFSCSEKEPINAAIDPIKELQFEIVDSIKVDVLEQLAVLDYLPSKDLYLMKELRKGNIFVINGKGEIVENQDISGEGPNQIQMVSEVRFFGDSGYIFKEFSATMDYNLYNLDFQKTKKYKGTMKELMAFFIYNYHQSFSVFEMEGKPFLIGEEFNSFSIADIDYEKIGADFYNKANTGFLYDLEDDSIRYFNVYPEEWVPKLNQLQVGQSFPLLAYSSESNVLASLPTIGNYMGLYKHQGNEIIYEKSVNLSHPDRDGFKASKDVNMVTYPGFSDIKSFGNFHLIQFYSAMPEDIYNSFKSKGEDFNQDPEYREALSKYRNRRYLVVKGDQQIGIMNKLPVDGNVNLGLSDGTLIIKAADGKVERDYNLFYKIRLVED